MAINSTNSNSTGGKSLTYSQILSIFPSNMNGAISSYVRTKILAGVSPNNLFNQSEYLSYVESLGFTLELYNNNYYAKKVFTSTQSWTVPSEFRGLSANVTVVAGGGGGGTNVGGGGGAGGVINNGSFVTSEVSYTATVGAGGVTRVGPTSPGGTEPNGSNSIFGSLTAVGGGGAGSYNTGAGNNGGSGGGGSGWTGSYTGGTGISGQGFSGGNGGGSSSGTGGGGGGASGAGSNGVSSTTTNVSGGPGISIFGVTYSAGGLGAGDNVNNVSHAAANSGNGGDGNGAYDSGYGRNGGSGIIILRYQIT
jgi:hypothetical protein